MLLFSYTILFDFNFEYEKTTNDTTKAKKMSKDDSSFSRIRIFETILLIWIASLMLNELKEVKKNLLKYIFSVNYYLFNKLLTSLRSFRDLYSLSKWIFIFKKYLRDQWNVLDTFGCLLYVLGIVLKSR